MHTFFFNFAFFLVSSTELPPPWTVRKLRKIEEFGDKNFHNQEENVEFPLAFRKLDDVVTDTMPPENRNELLEWEKQDTKARAIISFTLSDDRLDHVRGSFSAADTWKALGSIFISLTRLKNLDACRRLYTARMNDVERAQTYISCIRQL